MAREYGRVWLSIWSDFEFGQLQTMDQWLYLALISQPGMSTCGVLPFAPNRWAGLAADATVTKVNKSLKALERGHLVVVDRGTDELLIRSHIRYDRALRTPNVAKSVARTWTYIASPELQKAVLAELLRMRHDPEHNTLIGWSEPEIQELLRVAESGGSQ